MNNISFFDNNEGIGGFEQGAYDRNAKLPTNINWTGQSRYSIPKNPRLLWKTGQENAYLGEMPSGHYCVVGPNKEIIVSENDNNGDPYNSKGRLISIQSDGEIKELFHYQRNLKSPVLGEDGFIYIATDGPMDSFGHKLFCLYSDGRLYWEYNINLQASSNIVLDKSGNIYLFIYSDLVGKLLSISKEGKLNWEYTYPSVNWNEPTISKDGNIYIGLNIGEKLLALNKSGEKLWERSIEGDIGPCSIIIKNDGTLYVTLVGKVYSLNSNGSIKWVYELDEDSVTCTPNIDKNGILYIGLNHEKVAALNSEGKELWVTGTKGYVISTPIIGSNNIIYIVSSLQNSPEDDSYVEAFTTDGKKLWIYHVKGNIMSVVPAEDNLLYVLINVHNDHVYGPDFNVRWEVHAIGK